jgi:hypothetical protein
VYKLSRHQEKLDKQGMLQTQPDGGNMFKALQRQATR